MSGQSEILNYCQQKRIIYDILLSFIENDDENEEDYQRLIEQIEIQNIREDVEEIKEFLRLLSSVSNNHIRINHLISKIERILFYLSETFKHTLTNLEIFEIFKNNPRLYHFLHKNRMIEVTDDIIKLMNTHHQIYLPYFNKENELNKSLEVEEKLEIGENDSYLCQIIREDLIDDFVEYVSENYIDPSCIIDPSVYETNVFLLQNPNTSLIEYAAFFGATQIINYLFQANAELNRMLWFYAIHSNNPDVISFVEENDSKLKLKYYTLLNVMLKYPFIEDELNFIQESINCHHNALTKYLIDQFGNEKMRYCNHFINALKSRNYEFFLQEFNGLYDSCKFGYYNITFLLLQSQKFNPHDYDYQRLLKIAAEKNNYDIINLLLSQYKTSIAKSCFEKCEKLTHLNIPSTITSIGDSAFYLCSSLMQIAIPSSVASIGNYAFNGCSSLTQITIPSSVTSIGNYAFEGCSSLTQITIPSSVTSIGEYAFSECSSLTKISIPSSVKKFGDHVFSGIISLIIEGTIQKIYDNMFKECSSLTQITIPSTVTSIGNHAFSKCSSLTQITIPSSVTSIGQGVFDGCSSLLQVSNYSSATSTKNKFNGCSSKKTKNKKSKTPISPWGSNNRSNKNSSMKCENGQNKPLKSDCRPNNTNNQSTQKASQLKTNTNGKNNKNKSSNSTWRPNNTNNQSTQKASQLKTNTNGKNNKCKSSNSTWGPNNTNKISTQKSFQFKEISNGKNNKSKIANSTWRPNNINNQSTQRAFHFTAIPNNISNVSTANTTQSASITEYSSQLTYEYNIISMLDHPNVIKTNGLFHDDQNRPFIDLEECLTNLNEIVQNKIFTKAQLIYSIYQIAEGMKYIHSQKIMHLNLNPANILIADDFSIKISGFQNAQKITSESEFDETEDIISFGKIVYFILSGRDINDNEKEQVINSFTVLAQQLMEACFCICYEMEITFGMICDTLEDNNFILMPLSQQEIDEVSTAITQYKHQIEHYSE